MTIKELIEELQKYPEDTLVTMEQQVLGATENVKVSGVQSSLYGSYGLTKCIVIYHHKSIDDY